MRRITTAVLKERAEHQREAKAIATSTSGAEVRWIVVVAGLLHQYLGLETAQEEEQI